MQSHNNSMAKEMISLMLRYLEVKEAILERITRQEPNTRLPSRKKLCDEFLISRTTIDRAISDLLKDGYLYSVAGSGTFVADLTVNDTPVRTDVINIGVIIRIPASCAAFRTRRRTATSMWSSVIRTTILISNAPV